VCGLATEEQNVNVQVDDSEQPLVIKHYCTKLREKNKVTAVLAVCIYTANKKIKVFNRFIFVRRSEGFPRKP